MPSEEVEQGLASLRDDLESGRWETLRGHLRKLPELDVGLRLICTELPCE